MTPRFIPSAFQLIAVLTMTLAGCDSAPRRSTLLSDGAAATAPTITYHNRIAQIFASRCATCHYQGEPVKYVGALAEKTFQGAQAPYLTDYESIKKYAYVALAVMKSGAMPPAKNLGDTDIADLQSWISAGRPEGDPATAPQLSLSIKSILDRRCIGCHHPGGANDLSNYESASGPLHSPIIYAALNWLKNMPPAKNLTDDEQKALTAWTAACGPRDAYDGPMANAPAAAAASLASTL